MLFLAVMGPALIVPQIALSQSAEATHRKIIRSCVSQNCAAALASSVASIEGLRVDSDLYSARIGDLALALYQAASRTSSQRGRRDISSAFRVLANSAIEPAQINAMRAMSQRILQGDSTLFALPAPVSVSPS